MNSGTYRDPQVLDRDEVDLSVIREHWRTAHRGSVRRTPRANTDLSAAHAREHHHHGMLDHSHRGPHVLIRRQGRPPVGQIPRPLGWYTGQDVLSREDARAELAAKLRARGDDMAEPIEIIPLAPKPTLRRSSAGERAARALKAEVGTALDALKRAHTRAHELEDAFEMDGFEPPAELTEATRKLAAEALGYAQTVARLV